MNNSISFTSSCIHHLELWFSTEYTLEEITKTINKHILNNDYNITDTQIPKYYKKWHLQEDPSVLWD